MLLSLLTFKKIIIINQNQDLKEVRSAHVIHRHVCMYNAGRFLTSDSNHNSSALAEISKNVKRTKLGLYFRVSEGICVCGLIPNPADMYRGKTSET